MATGEARPIRVAALTPAGAALARRLARMLPGAVLWLPPSQALPGEPNTFTRFSQVVEGAFREREDLVCIMAAGIVVRTLAPFLKAKDTDPAVVVVDEQGQFAVSLLSGHLGGANDLAREIARLLGGTPVITTATDVEGLPALDSLAGPLGLAIENLAALRPVHMAWLQGRPVPLWDEEGRLSQVVSRYPGLFVPLQEPENSPLPPGPAVYVGLREHPWPPAWLLLRPRLLTAGVGCHIGTPAAEILDFLKKTFREAGLSLLSLKALATVTAKQAEPGLIAAARELGVPLLCFTAQELHHIPVPNPSSQPLRHVHTQSVCEAAALKAAAGKLLIPKCKSKNVTLAVARAA